MYEVQKKPYITVLNIENNEALYEGVVHSLEECGIPFQCRISEVQSDREEENYIFDIFEAPLGMVIIIRNCELQVYYSGYDRKQPVLHCTFLKEMEEDSIYRRARRIGCNAANLIYGKEMKELEWNSN